MIRKTHCTDREATKPAEAKTYDGLTAKQVAWIQDVANGQEMVKALGSRFPSVKARRIVHKLELWLANPVVRGRLLSRVLLAGRVDLAEQIQGYAAALAASEALAKGDARLILALLPKASAKPGKAKELPSLPAGRSVDSLSPASRSERTGTDKGE